VRIGLLAFSLVVIEVLALNYIIAKTRFYENLHVIENCNLFVKTKPNDFERAVEAGHMQWRTACYNMLDNLQFEKQTLCKVIVNIGSQAI